MVITSYTTVTSEYASFAPEAKDESRKPKSKSSKSKTGAEQHSDSDSSDGFTKKLTAKGKSSKNRHALFRVKWFRVVLGRLD